MGKPMVILSAKEIDKMRIAGRFAAELLDHLGGMLKPGITTQALNDEAEKLTKLGKQRVRLWDTTDSHALFVRVSMMLSATVSLQRNMC